MSEKLRSTKKLSPAILRAEAAKRLYSIIDSKQQKSLDAALKPALEDEQQQAWLAAALYGVCRFIPRYQAQLSARLKKPFKAKDAVLESLIILGQHQLTQMQVKSHAAINETVNACQVLNKQWAKGLVNAVLRGYQRDLQSGLEYKSEVETYSHPKWLIEKFKQDWPEYWQQILAANNQQAPMSLRVNQAQWSRDQAQTLLNDHAIVTKTSASVESALALEQAVDVNKIPRFSDGYFSVQDVSAQLAAYTLLSAEDSQRDLKILDACAAPGGKTGHLLERMSSESKLTAVEKFSNRTKLIEQNLQRIGLCDKYCEIHTAEIQDFVQTSTNTYDRILADVPCTASGVIRRHPDIKLRRSKQQLQKVIVEQQAILNGLWSCLQPGGRLLYVTCSVFPEENQGQIQSFQATHPDAKVITLDIDKAVDTGYGSQIMPGSDNRDGFFYALLEKSEH